MGFIRCGCYILEGFVYMCEDCRFRVEEELQRYYEAIYLPKDGKLYLHPEGFLADWFRGFSLGSED